MKMSQQRYNLLRDTIQIVVNDVGLEKCHQFATERNDRQLIWLLHTWATDQLQYDDSHPFFQNGTWTRLTPCIEGFKTYKDNGNCLNDFHIETALKRIGKELGLFVGNWPGTS